MVENLFRKVGYSNWLGIGAGVIYGLLVRFAFDFASHDETLSATLAFMTIGYIFLVPAALGAITVYFAKKKFNPSWPYRIFMPWMPCLLLLAMSFVIGWEGAICLLMAAPVFLLMASLGGIAAYFLSRTTSQSGSGAALIFGFALLPFIVAPLESRLRMPQTLRTVETQIVIHADPATVWRNIIRVPEIQAREQRFSFFHAMGFPRPVEATLSHEGVGGVRHATFERGVLFVETIDAWEEMKKLSFKIKADTKNIPPATLDEHVTIGGEYFDTLQGRYLIEPLDEREVILHLSSNHRLSTHFNFYAGLWTDAIMAGIQNNILQIIKARCEAAME